MLLNTSPDLKITSSNDTKTTLEDITIKLKLISSTDKNVKLNTFDCSFVNKDSLFGSFWRYIKGENYRLTIDFLNTIYLNAMVILNGLKDDEHDKILNLISDIFSSFKGLETMKTTYSKNSVFVCTLTTLIQTTVISVRNYVKNKQLGDKYIEILREYDTYKNILVFPYNDPVKKISDTPPVKDENKDNRTPFDEIPSETTGTTKNGEKN